MSIGLTGLLKIIENEAYFMEHHTHRRGLVFGISADQSSENWATENRLTPFQAISGNNDFGSDANDEAKIFGQDDTPFQEGHLSYDLSRILIDAVSSDTTYILRFIWGKNITMNEAIALRQYTTIAVKFDSLNPAISSHSLFEIRTPILENGTRCWLQCKNATDNATIDFYISGAHGYSRKGDDEWE